MPDEDDLSAFAALGLSDHRLCVLSTTRADGSIQSTVVNAGVVQHPSDGHAVVGVLADARSRKVANLRARPAASVVVKSGWNWATVEGRAEVFDGRGGEAALSDDQYRGLLRGVFAASIGGVPGDWEVHVDNMNLDEHVVILVTPARTYSGAP